GDDTSQHGVIAAAPKALTAWRMLKARIESAASAFTALSPLVRNLPPPDIRLIVPNGCSTVHRRIVIKLGPAWIRASMRSSALLIDEPVDSALGARCAFRLQGAVAASTTRTNKSVAM
ncbi:MAG TPA: hypothetical protein VMS01_04800, partial [Stellaceae bacterium]|nr:hypothetical protein [Stellaceae bacterium]